MLPGLRDDLVAAGPCLLGETAAVGLRVGDVPVGGQLGAGQYPHGVHVRVVSAEDDGVVAVLPAQNPAAQPLHFLPQ